MFLLAQFGGLSLVHLVIMVIIVAAVIAIMYVALRQFGIQIPVWAQNIFWILIVAVVAIGAIKLLAGMW